jgi:transposase InsO family protein
MGSVGDAYDNAMAESFFSTLECELLARRKFASKAEARMACFSYIEAGTTRSGCTPGSATDLQSSASKNSSKQPTQNPD